MYDTTNKTADSSICRIYHTPAFSWWEKFIMHWAKLSLFLIFDIPSFVAYRLPKWQTLIKVFGLQISERTSMMVIGRSQGVDRGATVEKALLLVLASQSSLVGHTTRKASPAEHSAWLGRHRQRRSFKYPGLICLELCKLKPAL